jgi:hypothetical protein
MSNLASSRYAAILADRFLDKTKPERPKLEGDYIWERVLSFLSQQSGSTTAQVKEALGSPYSPNTILNKLKAKGRIRAEYTYCAKSKGVVARWWIVTA